MKKLNQQGAVAMISVVIFSIILSILVAAYARTVVSQQRQAVNYDLSTRAYYAAESGVQDAIRLIKDTGGNNYASEGKDSCPPPSGYGDFNGSGDMLGYTCQLIDSNAPSLPIQTGQDTSFLTRVQPIDFNSTDNGELTVTWRVADQDESSNYVGRTPDTKLFPPTTEWQDDSGAPVYPVLRLSFVQIPNAPFGRDAIKQYVYFLNPTNGDAEAADLPADLTSRQSEESVVRNARCDGNGCSATFNVDGSLFNGKQIYMVYHSLYGNVVGEATLRSGGKEKTFKGVATIDVTGRAGDVFRRVKQTVNVEAGSGAQGGQTVLSSYFDSSGLIVGDGICKFFTVGTTPSQYQNQCN